MQAGPSSRVGFRNHGEFLPGQISFDGDNIRDWRTGIFSVAAVNCPAHAAHERSHLSSRRELTSWARFYRSNTLNADNLRRFGPLPSAHVVFGVVNAECFHFDKNGAWLGNGIR